MLLAAVLIVLEGATPPAHAYPAPLVEADLCVRAKTVVIVRAVDVFARLVDRPGKTPDVETVALMELESILTGNAPDTFTVVYPGGRVGNIGSSVSDTPNFRALGRYILAIGMSWDVGERGEWPVGDRDLLRWTWLDANGTLPAPALLRAIWREHCAADFDPEREGRPTAPFTSMLPAWVLERCEHY